MHANYNKNTVVLIKSLEKKFRIKYHWSLKDFLSKNFFQYKYTKHFSVLKKINLNIKQGDSIALLGLNGSGKSTLLKMISGVMKPDKGFVKVKGSIAGLIEIGAGFIPDLTGRENVYLNGAILGMDKEEINQKFNKIVNFSGVRKFIDTEIKFFSSGMYLRLAFAVAIHSDPDLFLIDEILAVGDMPFQNKCIHKIQNLVNEKKTLIIVSHDLNLISKFCTRSIVLQNGSIIYDGSVKNGISIMNKL